MYDDNEPTMMGQARPKATLVVRQGTQAGMSFPLSRNEVIIGREEGVDVVLQDPEASRRHARISWQGRQFVIEDLGSTNGTFVNGVQVTSPQILSPGDGVGIGQTALVFQVAGVGMGAASYQQPPLQQTPAYVPPSNAPASQDNKTSQYLLYGCGCLLLLCICGLLAVAALALIDPVLFEELTGIGISFHMIPTYLKMV